ncbi:MAG: Crp/Fnr family transcriptional regulator [Methylococcaceae bacterium]|nr:Crp/Fnr family transcriptional regulator [Methylococcaceae bacterium]
MLAVLAANAKLAKFPKHATIITEGEVSSSLYIVLTGKVRVFTSYADGKEVTLLTQGPGSYFGELALLTDEPRSASVTTLESSVCGIITRADFLSWLTLYPAVAIDFLGILSEKVKYLTEKIKQLALFNVYERTISVLKDMARQEGDCFIIDNRPTQQELASMVGASREMVNKVMKELTRGGYVVVLDKSLRIEGRLPSNW